MLIHEDFVAFTGDARRAFEIALQTLLPLGFEVAEQSSISLVATGPGFNSTRQNALLGISRAEFSAERSSLVVKAELGGLDRFQRLMLIFMISLGAFDSLLLLALWFFIERLRTHTWFLAIPVIIFIPWIFIARVMTRWISKRTKNALNTLLHNMAMLA